MKYTFGADIMQKKYKNGAKVKKSNFYQKMPIRQMFHQAPPIEIF